MFSATKPVSYLGQNLSFDSTLIFKVLVSECGSRLVESRSTHDFPPQFIHYFKKFQVFDICIYLCHLPIDRDSFNVNSVAIVMPFLLLDYSWFSVQVYSLLEIPLGLLGGSVG